MKRILLVILLAHSCTVTPGWNPFPDDAIKKAQEFTRDHFAAISLVVGTLLVIALYKSTRPGHTSLPLDEKDFFRIK